VIKFDHLRLPVTDLARSRDWYIRTLGLTVEFEVPERQTVALQDSDGFTIFLQEVTAPVHPNDGALCIPGIFRSNSRVAARSPPLARLQKPQCSRPAGRSPRPTVPGTIHGETP